MAVYTPEQIQNFRTELSGLIEARTRLLSGRQSYKIVINSGQSVEYQRIDIPWLSKRIGELENILAPIDNPTHAATALRVGATSKGL